MNKVRRNVSIFDVMNGGVGDEPMDVVFRLAESYYEQWPCILYARHLIRNRLPFSDEPASIMTNSSTPACIKGCQSTPRCNDDTTTEQPFRTATGSNLHLTYHPQPQRHVHRKHAAMYSITSDLPSSNQGPTPERLGPPRHTFHPYPNPVGPERHAQPRLNRSVVGMITPLDRATQSQRLDWSCIHRGDQR